MNFKLKANKVVKGSILSLALFTCVVTTAQINDPIVDAIVKEGQKNSQLKNYFIYWQNNTNL